MTKASNKYWPSVNVRAQGHNARVQSLSRVMENTPRMQLQAGFGGLEGGMLRMEGHCLPTPGRGDSDSKVLQIYGRWILCR